MVKLHDLKSHLQTQKRASLASMVVLFNEDALTLEQMLQHFVLRGQARVCRLTSQCGKTCHQCPVADTIAYEWVVH